MESVYEKHEQNEPRVSVKFQVYATLMVLLTALTAGALGVILSENQVDPDVISWIGLPGDLFIRALKCAVLPLVFVNIILAIAQMGSASKAAVVGKYTVFVYMTTTLLASVLGLTLVLLFESQFSDVSVDPTPEFINILCPSEGYILYQKGNTVGCTTNITKVGGDGSFIIEDLNKFYSLTNDLPDPPSFTESMQDNVFRQLVPENILLDFSELNFVGVVSFAIFFGVASQATHKENLLLINFLEDVNDVFIKMIQFFIYLTPPAIFSLIAAALANQEDLAGTMQDIGILLLVMIIGDIIHVLIVLPTFFYMITRKNPYAYMKYIIPAQSFAFACASSAASLPVTMACVKESGQVPDSIRDFVLPIGATLNMDGAALFFPPVLIFLANTAGISSGPAEYFLIIIASTIGSAGAAPVPNAGILLLIAAFNTVYGQELPENFAILVGIQFLVDRTQVVVNVTGDAMAARVISYLIGGDKELATTMRE